MTIGLPNWANGESGRTGASGSQAIGVPVRNLELQFGGLVGFLEVGFALSFRPA